MSTSKSRDIHDGWSFRRTDKPDVVDANFRELGHGEGFPVQEFPTTVHVELLKRKLIPDPFIGLNEWDVQWIGEADWEFTTTFDVSEEELHSPNVDLVFDGLDTFATVTLNGKELFKTENQFVSHRVPAKDSLKATGNQLVIAFESAFRKGRQLEKDNGGKLLLWNGDSSRLHVRKAQYNYGWDWGPVLMTVGPWKPIRLETYQTRIEEVDVRTDVSEKLDASIHVRATLSEHEALFAYFEILNPEGKSIIGQYNMEPIKDAERRASFGISKHLCEPWYPAGYGKQTLYTARLMIKAKDGTILDVKEKKFGIRRVVVVQEPLIDQPGRTFLFEVNYIRIFCGGSNWIPADSFLTTVTRDRYRAWLQLLIDGNQNMVRVWGGGIYEADDFYEICDELGIMVWQDFMFGCGQYPAYDSFVKNVKLEAEQNVKRLRHHPSIVIFAGNNEDYQLAESYNLQLDYSDETSDYRDTNFPARYIYERLLPEIVSKHSNIHYHPSSPYSGFGQKTTDQTHGDLHQWNVWHGSQEPWHNWDILAGRFVSEFGMEGYPSIRTVDYWLGGNKAERYPQSRTMKNHNKADGYERRLELYLMENFKHAFDMESYVYYTQIMQAETLASAYRLWRRNWKGKGREYTAGALVWQINDCWPVTSWAIVDYFLRPKPAYFAIKRELAPHTVGITRKDAQTFPDALSAATFAIETRLEVWGTNATLEERAVRVRVATFDLGDLDTDADGEKGVRTVIEEEEEVVVLAPNASTELWKGALPGQPTRTKYSEVPKMIVVQARLLDKETGAVIARYTNWPEPYKFIAFPPVPSLGLTAAVGADGETVTLSAAKPVKGLVLDVEGEEEVQWSDQAIDLFPGDEQVVRGVGLKGREVRMRFLGDGSA